MRESPTFELMDLFKEQGAEVDYHDPHIPVITPTREHAEWTGIESVDWNQQSISSYDVIVIATHHKVFNLQELTDWADLIVDTRNALVKSNITGKEGQITKA
jgi:UDP-N-acetyl-D-glucosamine dehydrogenase